MSLAAEWMSGVSRDLCSGNLSPAVVVGIVASPVQANVNAICKRNPVIRGLHSQAKSCVGTASAEPACSVAGFRRIH